MKKRDLTLVNKCTANITVKGNKIKEYGNGDVYLKNGQEFEIELNNYTQDVVAAKILMNGKAISDSRVVIKPGQKVKLDRFIDENKKFLFDTYEVGGDSEAVQKAIESNGTVEVQFYKEYNPTITTTNIPDYWYNGYYNSRPSYSIKGNVSSYSGNMTTNSLKRRVTTAGGQSGMMDTMSFMSNSMPVSDSIETGRVEKGSDSNQKFSNYVGNFNSTLFMAIKLKLLPLQYKPTTISDLAEYCVKCGTKNKRGNYKFCPKCGNKY